MSPRIVEMIGAYDSLIDLFLPQSPVIGKIGTKRTHHFSQVADFLVRTFRDFN